MHLRRSIKFQRCQFFSPLHLIFPENVFVRKWLIGRQLNWSRGAESGRESEKAPPRYEGEKKKKKVELSFLRDLGGWMGSQAV